MDAIKEQKLIRLIEMYEARIEALDVRLAAAEEFMTEEIDKMWAGLNEVGLRQLFTMQYFQFRKTVPTGVLDVAGQMITEPKQCTLYELYLEQRDTFIAQVQANEEAIAQQQVAAPADVPATVSADDAPPRSASLTLVGPDGQRFH